MAVQFAERGRAAGMKRDKTLVEFEKSWKSV
jgi:hypothetical protein